MAVHRTGGGRAQGEGHAHLVALDGLLAELRAAETYPDGITAAEAAEHWQVCRFTANRRIASACLSGKAKCVGYRRVPRIDGKSSLIPVYQVET